MHNSTHIIIIWFVVPEPEVNLLVGSDGSFQTTSLDHFTVSCLIKVDPAVDTPVEVEAVWSGNPSLSDSPRVTVQPVPLGTPYLTSITFTSITPHDLGEYKLAVRVGARSGEGIIDSSEVHRTASISKWSTEYYNKKVILYYSMIMSITDTSIIFIVFHCEQY